MIDRETLFEMAAEPIGSPKLMAEADHIAHTMIKPSPELREAAQRANKRWLPEGKIAASSLMSKEAEAAFYANQTDLEDAVEAAGGERGRLA